MKIEDYREQERDWASRLRGLSLVSEAGIDPQESLDAFCFVFFSYRAQSGVREDRLRLLRRYPASLLAGMTAIASSRYDEGTFWPKLGEEVGTELTQPHQNELSDSFRYGLESLHLSRFDTPLRNVGEILMHAGIPALSADSFLRLLSDRRAKRPDLTGEDFCIWVSGMDRATAATKGLDAPTWRFLKDGGEFAIDLTDRFLAFIEAAASHRSALVEDALDAIPVGLVDVAEEFYRSGGVQSLQSSSGARRRFLTPRIVYVDGQVQIQLPVLDSTSGDNHSWAFSTSGQSWTRQIRAGHAATTSLEPLDRPITDVVVQHRPSMQEWEFRLVDSAFPLLAFEPDTGKLIPPNKQLPASWVWLAFPVNDGVSLEDALDVDGDLHIIERADTPSGWKGWCFAKVDLGSVRRLRLREHADRGRLVSTTKRPTLKLPPPIPFTRTSSGSPIYDTRPTLILPPVFDRSHDQASLKKWNVQLIDSSGTLISSRTVEAGPSETTVDPWEDCLSGIAGEFELRARRALGQIARFEIALVEGISVDSTPQFRNLDSKGILEPALVTITVDNVTQEVRIEAEDLTAEITVESNGSSLDLQVAPEHMWLGLEEDGIQTRRTTGPVHLEIEGLGNAVLRFATSPDRHGNLALICERSVISQEDIAPGTTGVVKFPLSRLHDAAQKYGGGDLYYQLNGNTSLVGRIRPRRLVSDVTLLSDSVAIERIFDNLDLRLELRLDNAPWLRIEPLRFPPGQSSACLPDVVDGRGPLTVIVQPYDPWELGSDSPQLTHDRENEFHIAAQIDYCRDSLEDRFIHWTAGLGPIPDDRSGIEFALDAYKAIRQCRPRERADALASDIADLTERTGPRFLAVAALSQWSQSSHTRLLVEGWPATAKAMSYPVEPDLWRRSPYLGLLVSLGSFRDAETATELRERLGNEACDILLDGHDPAMPVGTFGGSNVDELADKPRELQDLVWKNYISVPGKPLDKEQRLLNARVLFDNRSDTRLYALIDVSPAIVEEVASILKLHYDDAATKPLYARKAPKNWRQLPQTSLALAFAARMVARARKDAADTLRFARKWYPDLADCAPGFVEQDLILAELWLTHWERQ